MGTSHSKSGPALTERRRQKPVCKHDSVPSHATVPLCCVVVLLLVLQPCPQNTVTDDQFAGTAATPPYISPDSCLAKPGYCWANNIASKAPIGYYKPGYNNMDCSTCGTGLTTLQEGADEPSDCVPLPGWEKQAASDEFAVPCLQGYYSAGGDSAVACSACPLGSPEAPA